MLANPSLTPSVLTDYLEPRSLLSLTERVQGPLEQMKDEVECRLGHAMKKVGVVHHGCGETPVKPKADAVFKMSVKATFIAKKSFQFLGGLLASSFRGACRLSRGLASLRKVDLGLRALDGLNLPRWVWTLIQAPWNVVCEKTWKARTIAALEGVDAVGSLGGFSGTVLAILHELGAVSAQVMGWVQPIMPLFSLFGAAYVGINGLHIHETSRFRSLFLSTLGKGVEEGEEPLYDRENLKLALEQLSQKDEKFLKRQFNVNYDLGKEVKVALEQLEQGGEEERQKVSLFMHQLKTRLSMRLVSKSLKLLAGSVGLVALPILLSGVASLAGQSLALFAGVTGLSATILDLVCFSSQPVRFPAQPIGEDATVG